jgi:hypothetical protein
MAPACGMAANRNTASGDTSTSSSALSAEALLLLCLLGSYTIVEQGGRCKAAAGVLTPAGQHPVRGLMCVRPSVE